MSFFYSMQEITFLHIFLILHNFWIPVLSWNLWVIFKRAKAVLEQCFLENKSEPLKEDESKAVGCLQSFFNEKLVEQFQDIRPSLKQKSELFVNFSIAHNILSPLTDECMLKERHGDYLGLGCT